MAKHLQWLSSLWKRVLMKSLSENLGWLRLFFIATLSLGAASIGIWRFETVATLPEFFHQVARYMIAPISAFLIVFLSAAHYIQDIYELDSFPVSLHYLWASLFHSLVPRLKITEGKMQMAEESRNPFAHVGGPAYLNIDPGNLVVLERLDSPSNILGPGRHTVGRYERIKNILSLLDQHVQTDGPFTATTKDGISVTTHNLQVRCRVHTGYKSGEPKRTLRNPYPYSVKAVRDLTYRVTVDADGKTKPWQKIALSTVVRIVTEFINSNMLDRVIYQRIDEKDLRNEIVHQIESPLTRNKLKSQGVDLLWYDLGYFQVAADIEQKRQDARFANLWGAASVIRAQGEAERIANHERGLAEGQINLLSGMIQALNEVELSDNADENLWNIVLARSAQIIESMTTIYKSVETPDEVQYDNES